MVATRMREKALKRDMKKMPFGRQLKIHGPLSSWTLHSQVSRPAVLLAGGTGITLPRSMIVNAAREGLTSRVMLFYSNRRREDCAQQIGSGNKNYQTICAMTQDREIRAPVAREDPLDQQGHACPICPGCSGADSLHCRSTSPGDRHEGNSHWSQVK